MSRRATFRNKPVHVLEFSTELQNPEIYLANLVNMVPPQTLSNKFLNYGNTLSKHLRWSQFSVTVEL